MNKSEAKQETELQLSSGGRSARKDGRKNAWWQRPKKSGPRLITVTDPDGKVSYLKKTPHAVVWIDVEESPSASNEQKF
jgi:hypothetical protein